MAQLRQDYEKFVALDAEIVVVGPDSAEAFRDYWQKEDLPYVGLADPSHTVAKRYGQEVKLLKMGRMPALMVIRKDGEVAYKHYGGSMSDIPPNPQILSIVDGLNQEAG
jgi:peroxiredoxin Q/BCP